jgi:cell division protein FtsN
VQKQGQRRTPAGATRRSAPRAPLPAWAWLATGLALGAIAVAVFDIVREKLAAPAAAAAVPAVLAVPADRAPPPRKPAPRPAASTAPPEKRFEFYDMLPNFEVVVPEEDGAVRPDQTAAAVTVPGVYVLQAGSYSSRSEADKAQARLQTLGIAAQVQKITVDERQYHRVRIGPIETLPELNRTRQNLRRAGIEALLIRVGE